MIDLVSKLKEAGIVSIRDELLRQKAEGKSVVRTESGDPSFNIPESVKRAIKWAVDHNKTHYTPGAGISNMREKAASKLIADNGFKSSPENILITSGAMNALYVTYRALVESANFVKVAPEFLVPTPTWTETVTNVNLAGGKPVYYNLLPENKDPINLKEIEEKITDKTIAIVINTPHNPTGAIIGEEQLRGLLDLCQARGIYLISDEAYEHIVYYPYEHISPGSLSDYDRIISIFSCSKSYAMSGLRLGYLECRNDLKRIISKYIRCTVNGVNSVSQHGGAVALSLTKDYFDPMFSEYNKRLNVMLGGLTRCSLVTPVIPKGAFYVWAKINDSRLSSWELTCLLLENGVGSAPGDCFGPGGEGYVRFSFSCSTDQVSKAAEILATL